MAVLIWWVFFPERMRRRMSIRLGMRLGAHSKEARRKRLPHLDALALGCRAGSAWFYLAEVVLKRSLASRRTLLISPFSSSSSTFFSRIVARWPALAVSI